MKEPETFEEAVELCKRILERFKPHHPRISVFVGFLVRPAIYDECPIYITPEEALEAAKQEDKLAEEWRETECV